MDPMNVMGLPTTNPPMGPPPPAGGMNHPQTNLTNGGYRCGSNTSSSSGRGSSLQHASLPRHFSSSRTTSEAVSPLSEVPPPSVAMGPPQTMGGNTAAGLSNPPLPTVSAQIQHHYTNKYNRYNTGYQYNSHYRGPPPPTQPRSRPVQNTLGGPSNPSDYAHYNSNVGKEIDV